jgi:hypothetical protein
LLPWTLVCRRCRCRRRRRRRGSLHWERRGEGYTTVRRDVLNRIGSRVVDYAFAVGVRQDICWKSLHVPRLRQLLVPNNTVTLRSNERFCSRSLEPRFALVGMKDFGTRNPRKLIAGQQTRPNLG